MISAQAVAADDIDIIRRSLGVEKVNIPAHSWGVLPATEYGILYPDKIKEMVFVDPVPLNHVFDEAIQNNLRSVATSSDSTDRAIIRGSKSFKSGRSDAYRQLLLLSFRHSFYKPEDLSKLDLDIPSNYASQGAALYKGLGNELASYDFYDSLRSFPFPVLILTGIKDPTPIAAIDLMKTKLKSAQVWGCVIEPATCPFQPFRSIAASTMRMFCPCSKLILQTSTFI